MKRALALTSFLLLAACGVATVDTAAIEKDVKATVDGPGTVKVASVDCPEDEPATAGTTFTCPFELTDGSSGEVTVKVQKDDGSGRWEVSRPASGQAEQEIWTGYEDQTGDKVKTVDCPDPIKTAKGEETICTIELEDGSKGDVTVRVVNDGDIRWEVK